MLDTNVLVSAVLYPHSSVTSALLRATQKHTLVICTYVLEELHSVFERKFPHKQEQLSNFLSNFAYEPCPTPSISQNTPTMRDDGDRPILQAAIDSKVDMILTGDLDFHVLELDYPRIIAPAEFLFHQRIDNAVE